ncbi:MAG: hypothetical protein EOP49_25960, partial [Sphingobacteriales bacterium]
MSKGNMIVLTSLLLVAGTLAATHIKLHSIYGNGKIDPGYTTIPLPSFHAVVKLEADKSAIENVSIMQAVENNIQVAYNDSAYVRWEVRDDTLFLSKRPLQGQDDDDFNSFRALKIGARSLHALDGGGSAVSITDIRTDSLALYTSAEGSLNIKGLVTRKLKLTILDSANASLQGMPALAEFEAHIPGKGTLAADNVVIPTHRLFLSPHASLKLTGSSLERFGVIN